MQGLKHISSISKRQVLIALMVVASSLFTTDNFAQLNSSNNIGKASKKIEFGLDSGNKDSLAQGYFDLAESYYQSGDIAKSEQYYQKSKTLFERTGNATGLAKSSRNLAKVQEELHKNKEAINNYDQARKISLKNGDAEGSVLNGNDAGRLSKPDSFPLQEKTLQANIDAGIAKNDTAEIVNNYYKLGTVSAQRNEWKGAVGSYSNAYKYARSSPEQSLKLNQLITNEYVKQNDFEEAITTKRKLLNESFVQNSTRLQASELTSLADIFLLKNDDTTARRLLRQSYELSLQNNHTLEAIKSINKLDSLYSKDGDKEKAIQLYRQLLLHLPEMIAKDSALTDKRIIALTEEKLQKLEQEKVAKDNLISKKNRLNIWLAVSVVALLILVGLILSILKKSNRKNKQIALQSLRREMNPHFIFNSLNSINQFISSNNELAANQYLTRFSTLMRRVMENSKEDFVLLSREIELLQNYLELEKSRFPDKFDFNIQVADSLLLGEQAYIPGMLIQPHLENAIWHGLRYMDEKGMLMLQFAVKGDQLQITIEDNGIGIAASKKAKTTHQQKHQGRGISNTLERIKILNELYSQQITCVVEDKALPDHGVRVTMTMPLLKNMIG